jgi:hypothetical protein
MTKIDPGLNFFGHRVDAVTTLEDFELYISEVNQFLCRSARRFRGQCDEYGIDRSDAFAEVFPEILYASVIMAIVSFLERELRTFSDVLGDACASPLSARDISGSWLERFRKYCEKVAFLPLRLTDAQWEDLKGAVEVRNCLVHSGGSLVDFQGRSIVETYARRHKIDLFQGTWLLADLRMAKIVLSEIKGFLDHIYQVALDKYPKT